MQKVVTLLFTLIISFNTFAISAAEKRNKVLFVESLNHLNNKEYKEGITNFEKIFKETKDEKLKAEVAYLLVITKYDTRKGMRSNYGKYAYKHYTTISKHKRMDLARLTADLFFQEGELEDAQYFYEQIYTDELAPFEFREYAVYKSGWVLVNQEKYEKIFNIWSKWIASTTKGDLYEFIIHDYAKFYYEYYAIKKTKKIAFSLNFDQQHKHYPKLLEGLVSGFKRYSQKSPEAALTQLKTSPAYTPLLNVVLKDSFYFNRKPCKSLPFIRQSKLSQLSMNYALDTANSCFSEYRPYILGKRKGVKDLIIKTKKELTLTYPLLETDGTRNFAKGEYLFITKQYPKACKSFLKGLVSMNIKKAKTRKLSKALNAMGTSCQKSKIANINKELTEFYSKYVASSDFINFYRKNKKIARTFNNITLIPGHINIMSNIFVKNIDKWKGQDIVTNVLKKTYDNKDALFGIFYSFNFDILKSQYRDIFSSALHDIITAKKYEQAEELLEHFAPISHADSEFTKLWYLLSQTEFKKSKDFPQSYVVANRFEELVSGKGTTKSDNKFLTYYLLMNDKMSTVSNNWKKFKPFIYKDKTLAEKVVKTLVLDPKSMPTSRSLRKDQLYKFSNKIANALNNKNNFKRRIYVPKSIKRTPFGRDSFRIALGNNLLRDLRRAKIKKDADAQLLKFLQRTKYAMDRFTKHRWSNDDIYKTSKSYLIQSFDEFLAFAGKVKKKAKGDPAQIDQLVGVLNNWKGSL